MPIILNNKSITKINDTFPSPGVEIETFKTSSIRDGDTVVNVPVVPVPQVVSSVSSETIDANYKYMAFKHSGGSEDQTEYSVTFNADTECDILIVGGGGGGGKSGSAGAGGGGGAGGLIYLQNQTINSGSYIIKVGKGGDILTTQLINGYNGYDSSFGDNIAIGGGAGGGNNTSGGIGGSGGGGVSYSHGNDGVIPGTGTTNQGNDGGIGSSSNANSGGGGGSGSVGQNATTSSGGDGGTGTLINITGQDIYYAGGGGGGSETSNNPGLGKSGGGNGGGTDKSGTNASDDTGSGGGGAGGTGNGGAGGSGIVIIRYKVISDTITMQPQTLTHYTPERMYPPTRNLTSNSHVISGQAYGNGLYEVSASTEYDINHKAHNAFNTSSTHGYGGINYQYSSGVYNLNNYIVEDYKGDWVKIRFPYAITLTKYGFKLRPAHANRPPGKYKIYGSNDDTNWDILVHKTDKITYNLQISASNDYFEENSNINQTYQYFALVVNELLGSDNLLNFAEWYIYGKEYINEEPDYKVLTFTNDGSSQTHYTLTFDNPTECDILIVGGGGAGGYNAGGGGGAGGLVYGSGITLNGSYTIKVGNGGVFNSSANNIDNGKDSEFTIGTQTIIAKGGGSGGDSNNGGQHGGSGGGGATESTTDKQGGTSTQLTSFTFEGKTLIGYGNSGGIGRTEEKGGWTRAGGGGGGAGATGNTSGDYTSDTGQAARIAYGGDGGIGKQFNISGVNTYYAGGGGGSIHNNQQPGYPGTGGEGGGGNAGNPYMVGAAGQNGTGGGGGAGGGGNASGGNGGSGIVIIRYKQKYNQVPINAQWTYSAADTSVHHYGNVGIGTTASDTKKLTVRGDVNVIGDYYKNNETFGQWYKNSSSGVSIYRHSGNVGVGTSNPGYSLDVMGEVYASEGGISGNGSTSWITTSDSRIKENIVRASYKECYEIFKKINLYRYNYNGEYIDTNDKNQLGFIAQEVKTYLPDSVQERKMKFKNGVYIDDTLTLNVTEINYVMFGAFKYLMGELEIIKKYLPEPIVQDTVVDTNTETDNDTIEDTTLETNNDTIEDTTIETDNDTIEDTTLETNTDTIEDTTIETNTDTI